MWVPEMPTIDDLDAFNQCIKHQCYSTVLMRYSNGFDVEYDIIAYSRNENGLRYCKTRRILGDKIRFAVLNVLKLELESLITEFNANMSTMI